MTVNGGDGDDLFIVFHNLAVLTLNGGDGDDTFIIRAFALAGSQEDKRELTDMSGDAGADLVQYAVNAPVNINGGDGFDTVIVIGTEFGDDFVVTRLGVFGAGLNVNFVNIELLEVDGAEGDDRFFVLSTGVNFTTTITGGLGTDLFSVQGPTPANGVISNDLLGHSGIITHDVEGSVDPSQWSGTKVIGISANVADNDEPAIILTSSGGGSQVIEGVAYLDATNQGHDTYTIVLARPPLRGEAVFVQIVPPPGLVLLNDAYEPLRTISDALQVIVVVGATGGTFKLTFGLEIDRRHRLRRHRGGGRAGARGPHRDRRRRRDAGRHDVRRRLRHGEPPRHRPSRCSSRSGTLDDGFVATLESVQGGLSTAAGVNLCFDITGSGGCTTDEIQTVTIAGATGGMFTLAFGAETPIVLPYDAPAAQVEAALEALTGIDDVIVSKGVISYTVQFRGTHLNADVAQLVADGTLLSGANATATVQTLVGGGVVVGDAWWKPQTVRFGVDALVAEIPDIADIQHRVAVTDDPAGTIFGVVTFAVSTETDPAVSGDEYATIVDDRDGDGNPATGPFNVPSAALPEGLRGAYVKITGGDDEAAGQIRMILGSHRQVIDIGATGGTFRLSFLGHTTAPILANADAATVRDALEQLSTLGSGMVAVTREGGRITIELKGTLVVTATDQITLDAANLTGGSATIVVDATSLKLNKPWSVEPSPSARFEISLYSDVQGPNLRVRVYSDERPEIVVDESGGSTTVAEGSPNPAAEDTIRVRLSRAPVAGETVVVSLGGGGQLDFLVGGSLVTAVEFTDTGAGDPAKWDEFVTVTVRAKHDLVVEGFHKADLTLSAGGTTIAYGGFLAVADVADDEHLGVRVLESDGSTNVIEVDAADHGLTETGLEAAGFPFVDDYRIAPDAEPGRRVGHDHRPRAADAHLAHRWDPLVRRAAAHLRRHRRAVRRRRRVRGRHAVHRGRHVHERQLGSAGQRVRARARRQARRRPGHAGLRADARPAEQHPGPAVHPRRPRRRTAPGCSSASP